MKLILILIILSFIITACTPADQSGDLAEANKKILEQQNEIQVLKEEIDSLKGELKKTTPQDNTQKIDLTQWKEDEIVLALATKNPKFKHAVWFQYEYRDDGAYYDMVGEIFPIDQFYDIVYSKRNRQLTVNKLRLFNLDPGNKEIGDEKYQEYENNVNKKLIINSSLSCDFHQECRGTMLIICTTQEKYLYSWFSYPYLFITRDDNGETYQTFKEFYC